MYIAQLGLEIVNDFTTNTTLLCANDHYLDTTNEEAATQGIRKD